MAKISKKNVSAKLLGIKNVGQTSGERMMIGADTTLTD
jgi:hypothetical protein